jgi:hypothetical protein
MEEIYLGEEDYKEPGRACCLFLVSCFFMPSVVELPMLTCRIQFPNSTSTSGGLTPRLDPGMEGSWGGEGNEMSPIKVLRESISKNLATGSDKRGGYIFGIGNIR